ncbi:MAG: hypothetical protein K8R54_07445 [Bacteroidales bacterium]|nr:hypothetical protein [Bacteroidales bacterium]
MKTKLTILFAVTITFSTFGQMDNSKYILTIKQGKYEKINNQTYLLVPTTLTNNTDDTLKYLSMSCSWREFYYVNNDKMSVEQVICTKNGQIMLTLLPHKSVNKEIKLVIEQTTDTKLKFKIGFSLIKVKNNLPYEFNEQEKMKNIIWSNAVTQIDTTIPQDYFLPEKFSKSLKWEEAENRNAINEQFYCNKDSIDIKNCNQAFNIIDSGKNFCVLYFACKWCKANYEVAFPRLIKRLTDKTEIGLNPYVDLYISKRSETGSMPYIGSTGGKPGIHINEDIFTIAGRASWILNEITGENFSTVQPFTSSEKLEQFKQKWINWIKTLE